MCQGTILWFWAQCSLEMYPKENFSVNYCLTITELDSRVLVGALVSGITAKLPNASNWLTQPLPSANADRSEILWDVTATEEICPFSLSVVGRLSCSRCACPVQLCEREWEVLCRSVVCRLGGGIVLCVWERAKA